MQIRFRTGKLRGGALTGLAALADQMDGEELLKDKVLLLLARERELLTLRRRHARVSAWLTVAHNLSELVSPRIPVEETCRALASKLKSFLEFQKVVFLPLPSGPSDVRRLIEQEGFGFCNSPDTPALTELSRVVGMFRFMWCRLVIGAGAPSTLLVAGYERDKAAFYSPFEEADFGHWKSMGQHLGLLLRNATLIKQLELEKGNLQELNETLENRVAERTEEIASVNRGLAEALAAVRDRERRLQDDLHQARSFQQSILPPATTAAHVELASAYRPLELVGGDIFDVCELSPGHLRVFLADASGHGVQASLRTIVLKSEYDWCKTLHASPDTLFQDFNRRLAAQYSPGEMVCTACCFDLIAGPSGEAALRYVNAAHPALIHVAGDEAREIYGDGPFLGLRPDIDLPIREATLAPGDALFAYTDGLCDQLDRNKKEFPLGQAAVRALQDAPSMATVLERLVTAFDGFRGVGPGLRRRDGHRPARQAVDVGQILTSGVIRIAAVMIASRTRAPLRALLPLLVPLSLLAASGSALGQPQDPESLIEQAKALRQAGDDAAAYELYVRAHGISRTPRSAGQLALCEFELNRWVDSELHLQEALRAANDPWVRRNRPVLVEMMSKVKLRLARVEVVGRPEGAEVEVAGRAVGRLPLPGPLRVPAGEVFVRVAAPGYRTLRRTVTVDPEQLAQVAVELEPGQEEPTTRLGPAEGDWGFGVDGPVADLASGGRPRSARWQRQVGWVGIGMAGALGAAGGVGLLIRYKKVDQFNDYVSMQGTKCNAALLDKGGGPCRGHLDAADQARTLALVSFAGAGLVGIVSGILLATSPTPTVVLAGDGALLRWTF